MAFRTTVENMERKGWEFSDGESECRSCGATIFWGTNPDNGKNVSFDIDGRGMRTANYHFKNCSGNANAPRPAASLPSPNRDTRRSNYQPAGAAPAAADTHSLQESVDDLSTAVRALCGLMQAAVQRKAQAAEPTGVQHHVGRDGEPYDTGYPRKGNRK
jgi:hypothetical protein